MVKKIVVLLILMFTPVMCSASISGKDSKYYMKAEHVGYSVWRHENDEVVCYTEHGIWCYRKDNGKVLDKKESEFIIKD